MSSSYSPDLRIELIGTGDQAGVWGATTNNNLAYVLEQAVAGYVSVAVASANQALTYINGGTSTAADNQAVHASIALTTSTGANFAVYAPPASKQYTIYNASSFVATIYNSTIIGNTTAAGTGVAIPAGKIMTVWSDGTNFYQQNTHLNSPSFTTPALGTPASGTLTNCTGLPISTGVSGLGSGVATFLATPSSANLAAAVSDETGTGALVFANTPTLVTPVLGTPTSGTLTNCTGLPIATGVSGLGTGVATALAVSVGSAGAPVVNGGALGTPSSGTLTNATGLPVATGISGLGTGVATFLATPSSANLAAAVTGETGSGALVFATSPTLVTPILGTPTSGTLTSCTGLPIDGGTTGTLPVARGGTGATTFTSGALLKGAGTGAVTVASAADIVGQIGSTAVQNATTAANGGVTSVNGSTGAVTVASVGVGQTWQNVTSSRASGTSYTNSTGKPILVNAFSSRTDSGFQLTAVCDGVTVGYQGGGGGGDARRTGFVSFIVPNGSSYTVTYSGGADGSTLQWAELR
jgi:hypothetical protein